MTLFKRTMTLIITLALYGSQAFAFNVPASTQMEEYDNGKALVQEALDFYHYQVDSGEETAATAGNQLEANIKELLNQGVSTEVIKEQLTQRLPMDKQVEYQMRLEALKSQGANANEVNELAAEMAIAHTDTGAAFSSRPGGSMSSIGIIIGVIVVVLIAIYVKDELDDDDDDDDDDDMHHGCRNGHDYEYGLYSSYNGGYGCDYID